MYRKSAHYDGFAAEMKNGNLHIRYNKDGIQRAVYDAILELSEALFWLDTDIIGEEYCLSNFETGCTLYNCHSDKVYIFPFSYLETLKQGKTIILYARTPDTYDRELIESRW